MAENEMEAKCEQLATDCVNLFLDGIMKLPIDKRYIALDDLKGTMKERLRVLRSVQG